MTPAQPGPARDRREDVIEHARAALKHARRTIEVAFRANAPDWCDPNDHTTIKEIDRVLAEIAALMNTSPAAPARTEEIDEPRL